MSLIDFWGETNLETQQNRILRVNLRDGDGLRGDGLRERKYHATNDQPSHRG